MESGLAWTNPEKDTLATSSRSSRRDFISRRTLGRDGCREKAQDAQNRNLPYAAAVDVTYYVNVLCGFCASLRQYLLRCVRCGRGVKLALARIRRRHGQLEGAGRQDPGSQAAMARQPHLSPGMKGGVHPMAGL